MRASFEQARSRAAASSEAVVHRVRSAAAEIVEARMRVRVIPRWRVKLVATAINLVLIVGIGVGTLSTDEMAGVADAVLGVHSLEQMETSRPSVGMIVSVSARQVATVARDLAKDGVHVSFADGRVPTRATIVAMRSMGDQLIPEMPVSGAFLRWLRTSATLSSQAAAAGFGHRFYFLEPPGALR